MRKVRPDARTQQLRDAANGVIRNGIVGLRHFDEGVVTTLGAKIDEETSNYFIEIPEVYGPPGNPQSVSGLPKIPVVFSIPEDVFERYEIPIVVVRRDNIIPAMNRWHPGALQYRTASYSSHPVTYMPGTGYEKSGVSKVEQLQTPVPFDISYSITILARTRGTFTPGTPKTSATGQKNQINRILDYVLRIYQPYCAVILKDSDDEERTYEAFMKSIAPVDSIAEVSGRMLGFSLSLEIWAELNLAYEEQFPTVTGISIGEKVIK